MQFMGSCLASLLAKLLWLTDDFLSAGLESGGEM